MSLSGSIGPGVDVPSNVSGLALDANALASLRLAADRDPASTARQAATQFEALFMQELMKSMRAAVPKSGLFDGPGTDQYTSMLDSQLTQTMAGRPGGLADVIARQLTRHLQGREEGQPAGVGPQTSVGVTSSLGDPVFGDETTRAPGSAADAARAGTTTAVDVSQMNPVQVAFVEKMWPHAKAAERATGVPAAFVVGQAALESGWGKRDIRDADGNPSHNLFGIKATGGWQGRTVATMTTEYVDGEAR